MTAKLIRITGKAMLSLLLAVIVGAFAVVTVLPRAVHGVALTVLTGSMTPTIPVGSVVVVRPVDPGTLHVGDVVTYQKRAGRAEFVTHRITAIHTETKPVTLTTKGDANRGADLDPVPVTAVRGRVLFHVPYLGTFRNAVGTGGFGLLMVLLALIGYATSQLVSALADRRASRTHDGRGLSLQLLVATLPVARFPGVLPHQAARQLGMELFDEGDEAFTVTLTATPQHLDELALSLGELAPLSLLRSDVLAVPLCGTRKAVAPALEQVGVDHAA